MNNNAYPDNFNLGHSNYIYSVCLTLDGKYLFTGSADNTIKMWDIETGEELKTFIGHTDWIRSICISSDNKFLFSGGYDDTAKMWDIETGKEVKTFGENYITKHNDDINSICLSIDNKYLFTASKDNTVKMWDIENGKEVKDFTVRFNYINSICVSSNGKYLFTGDKYKTVNMLNIETGEELKTFIGHTDNINSICVSSNGKYLFTGSFDNTAKMWDIESGKELKTFIGHNNYITSIYITSICLSIDEKFFFTGSAFDNTAKMWDIESGEELKTFIGHTDWLYSICLSPDSKYLFTGSMDKTAKMWDIETGKELKTFGGHTESIESICLTSDSKYLFAISNHNIVKMLDSKTLKLKKTFGGQNTGSIKSICLSPDSKYLFTGSLDKTAKMWDIESGEELKTFIGHADVIKSICLSPDSKYLFTGSSDNTVKMWDIEIGKEVNKFSHDIDSICVSSNGKYLFIAGGIFASNDMFKSKRVDNETAKMWNIETGEELKTFIGYFESDLINSICTSLDSKYLFTAGERFIGFKEKTAKMWNIETGEEIKAFIGHSEKIKSICLSPDSKYLFTGSLDKTVKMWDIESGKELKTFIGHSESINSICLSPDSKYLFTASNDNTIKIWDIELGEKIKTFQNLNNLLLVESISDKYVESGLFLTNKTDSLNENKSFAFDNLVLNSSSNIKYFFTSDNKKIVICIEQKKSSLFNDNLELTESKILVIDSYNFDIISCVVVDNLGIIWVIDNSIFAYTLSDSNELFVYDFYQKQLKQVIDLKFYNQEDNGFDSFYAQDVFKINSNVILISDRINSITKIYDLVNGSENQYNFSISLSKNISLEEKSLLLDFDFSKLENIYTEYKNSYLILELITPNYLITSNLSGKIVIWDKYFQKISTIYENDIEISQFYASKDYASHGISKINDNLICLWGQAKNYSEKSLKLYELNTGVCKNIIISSPVFGILPISSDTFIFYTSDSIIFQDINSKKSFFSYDYSIKKLFDIDKEKILILTKEGYCFLISKNPNLNFISSFKKADFYFDDNFDYTNNWSIELLGKTFYIQKQIFIEDEIPNVPKYKTSFYFNSKYNEIIISNLDRSKYFHISKVEPNLDLFCLPLFKDINEIKNLFLVDNKIIIIDSKNKIFVCEKKLQNFSNNLMSDKNLFVDVSINDFTNTEKEIILGKEADLEKFEIENNIYKIFRTYVSLGNMYFEKNSSIFIEKSIFYYEKAKDIIEKISKTKNIFDVINISLKYLLKMAEEQFLEESKSFRDDITEEEIENSRKIRVNEFGIKSEIISLYLNLSTSYSKNDSGDPLENLLLSENILLELKNYDNAVELQSKIILIDVYIQISEIFELKNDFDSSFLYQKKVEEIMKSLPTEEEIDETLKNYYEEGFVGFSLDEEDSYTKLPDGFWDDSNFDFDDNFNI